MTDLTPSLQWRLDEWLLRSPHIRRLIVAFSGGLDSSVLLHVCTVLRDRQDSPFDAASGRTLEAIHIDHGLSPQAADWALYCREQCHVLGVPLESHRVSTAAYGEGEPDDSAKVPEARARDARYALFAACLDECSALLMGHHQDDQAETVLLRLLRGAGPAGLAGMPAARALGAGVLWRPLLKQPRTVLEEYARAQQLSWVEDTSNSDTRMDRNYLRHRVLPLIGERWPGWRESWQMSAEICAESAGLVSELARMDLVAVQAGPVPFTPARHCVDCQALRTLPVTRQRNVLRHWLQRETGSVVKARLVSRVLREVIPARADARPEVPLNGYRLRRHRRTLVLCPALPPADPSWYCSWRPERDGEELVLPDDGRLVARGGAPGGVAPGTALVLRTRRNGDQCQSAGRPRKSLSRKLQESGIPVWWRDRLPLVTVNDEVVWIPGVGGCVSEATAEQSGWAFDWYPPGQDRDPGHRRG
jgi:tRNA(Ile)-lysidine synthase